ncbi:MBL fold metallo-hydrolase [Tersicoccus sp. MR15.9]|uniref:MBL fold metallo-hydrolase n=1 Tax=Tersicoccus mangrovi TaxID=3121635 RepID=UPI002FE5BBCB
MASPRSPLPTEVAPDVFFVRGPAANWIILRDGFDFTLIDAGYPADTPAVLSSIRSLGLDPAHAEAVVLTHGHVDHTGAARHLSAEHGTPVLASADERPAVRGEVQYQVTVPQLLPHLWQPRALRWIAHAVKAGGLTPNAITTDAEASVSRLVDLPGAPAPIPTPGHTPGHTAYRLAGGAVATGDAVITAHPLNHGTRVQQIHPVFDHDHAEATRSLGELTALGNVTVLPGHGPFLVAHPLVVATSTAP